MPSVADFVCFMNDTGRGGFLTGSDPVMSFKSEPLRDVIFYNARIGAHPNDFWLRNIFLYLALRANGFTVVQIRCQRLSLRYKVASSRSW
jgi:hypothetical protein